MARYIHELADLDKIEVGVMSAQEAEDFDDLWPVEDCNG